MKSLILSVIALFLSTISISQSYEWARGMGGTNNDAAYGSKTDANGNVYSVGYFSDTVDFDPGTGVFNLISAGSYDIFVHKLDSNGNFVWAKSMGGPEKDIGYVMELDGNANVFITGYFRATANLDPNGTLNFTSEGEQDGFVMKLNSLGDLVWVKVFGGISIDIPLGIALDGSGNVLTSGGFSETVDFDPGSGTTNLVSNGNSDVYVLKLDPNGDFIWAKGFGGTDGDYSLSVAIDGSDNVISTGYFYDSVDFDPGTAIETKISNGSGDIWVQKLDANGNFDWVATMGSSSFDRGFAVVIDKDDNIISTGHFQDTTDFDPGNGIMDLVSNGGNDIYIQKLDADGKYIWVKGFGGIAQDYGITLTVDPNGSFYTAGYFNDTVDFDPGSGTEILMGKGNGMAYIQKLDDSGNFDWVVSFDGNNFSRVLGIHVDERGQIFTAGSFVDTVDFNPGIGSDKLVSNGSNDFFIHKLRPDVYLSTPNFSINKIKMYPNPSAGVFVIELPNNSSSGKVEITNVTGKLVYQTELSKSNTSINLMGLSTGVYFVKLSLENGQDYLGKVIIER